MGLYGRCFWFSWTLGRSYLGLKGFLSTIGVCISSLSCCVFHAFALRASECRSEGVARVIYRKALSSMLMMVRFFRLPLSRMILPAVALPLKPRSFGLIRREVRTMRALILQMETWAVTMMGVAVALFP